MSKEKKDQMSQTTGYGREGAPLFAYFTFTVIFIAFVAICFWVITNNRIQIPQIGILEMVLLGFATHKVSWLISKDVVTSFLRAPFTRYQQFSTPGAALMESGRGKGFQLALGELLTCPWCIGMYIAAIFVLAYIFFPDITRTIAIIFNVLMIGDFLHIFFSKAGMWMSSSSNG